MDRYRVVKVENAVVQTEVQELCIFPSADTIENIINANCEYGSTLVHAWSDVRGSFLVFAKPDSVDLSDDAKRTHNWWVEFAQSYAFYLRDEINSGGHKWAARMALVNALTELEQRLENA